MKCKLVKLGKFSGNKASIYSVYIPEENQTLLDRFLNENISLFKSEIVDIVKRLNAIGKLTGARIEYFKEWEGNPGDGVCALYDNPNSNLRLYCITYGTQIVILGGGGYKPKKIRRLQEDPKLEKENYFLRELSKKITQRIKHKDIQYSSDGFDLEGDFEFNDEDDE